MSDRLRQTIFVVLGIIVIAGMLLGTVLPALMPSAGPSTSAPSRNPTTLAQARVRIDELRAALAGDPDNHAWLVELGDLYFATEDYSLAADTYNKVLALDQENADVRTGLGTAYLAQGMTEQAITQYREALRIDPNRALAHYYLGVALAHSDPPDVEGALASWRTVVTLDPNGPVGQSAQENIKQYEQTE